MKTVFATLVLVMAFTTGFTCSKNTPPPTTEEVPVTATPPVEVPAGGVDSAATPAPTATPAK